jgi:hypothetical protein
VEAWGRSTNNPVGGWYGLKKGLRGRFACMCRRSWALGLCGWSTTPGTIACARIANDRCRRFPVSTISAHPAARRVVARGAGAAPARHRAARSGWRGASHNLREVIPGLSNSRADDRAPTVSGTAIG